MLRLRSLRLPALLHSTLLLAALALVHSCASLGIPGFGRESGRWTAGTAWHDVTVGSGIRSFLLHVPPAPRRPRPRGRFRRARSYPLVIVLHGSGGDAEAIEHASGMDSLADADGFLVAYPNGSKGLLALSASDWNAGVCCGAAARDHVNDVGFIGALVARVAAHVPVDRRRVYVAGFSDGARMAYRLACESAATIAAIGAVAGSLVDPQCAPARPVPVVAFHGTADEEVAYLDSARTAPPRPVPPATSALPPSVQFWAAEDGCRDVAVERVSPHVTRATFAPCDGADVVLYTIEGGVHGWPGEPPDGAGSKPPMPELRATDVMVRFFLSHSLRRPVAAASPGPVGSSERR